MPSPDPPEGVAPETAEDLLDWRKRIRVERLVKPWQRNLVLTREARRVNSVARGVSRDRVVAVQLVEWHIDDVRRRLGLSPTAVVRA
ncbi:MAG: hypothetical protein ACRDYC_11785, partial [Acidimicrobiales bacterium]